MAGKVTEREITIKVQHQEPVETGHGQSGSFPITVGGGAGTVDGHEFTFGVPPSMNALVIEFKEDKLESWRVRVADLIAPIYQERARLKEASKKV